MCRGVEIVEEAGPPQNHRAGAHGKQETAFRRRLLDPVQHSHVVHPLSAAAPAGHEPPVPGPDTGQPLARNPPKPTSPPHPCPPPLTRQHLQPLPPHPTPP